MFSASHKIYFILDAFGEMLFALLAVCGIADSTNKHNDVTNGSVLRHNTINAVLSEVGISSVSV